MITDQSLRVVGDRILIRPDTEDQRVEETESGLLTAPSLVAAVEGSDRTIWHTSGTVVQVGEWPTDVRKFVTRRLEQMEAECSTFVAVKEIATLRSDLAALPVYRPREITVGDRVIFSVQAGHDVTLNGEPFVIMAEKDVLAVLPAEGVV